jgi:tRNA 2-selenouridine synthase
MRKSEIMFLDIPREKRADYLVKHYAKYEPEALKKCVLRIQKKLGGDRTKEALESIDKKDFHKTAMLTLHYYDKAYMHSLDKNHDRYHVIPASHVDPVINAEFLQKYSI